MTRQVTRLLVSRRLTALVALLPSLALCAPVDTVLAAVAAEQAAPLVRIRTFIVRAGLADIYYVDRLRPGRTRVIRNPRQGGLEVIVIGADQWLRTESGWRRSPVPPNLSSTFVPSTEAMFRQGLSDAIERPGPADSRIVEGRMTWQGAVTCDGRVMMQVDAGGLPSLIRFKGDCAGKPTEFRQAYSYAGPVAIEPPVGSR